MSDIRQDVRRGNALQLLKFNSPDQLSTSRAIVWVAGEMVNKYVSIEKYGRTYGDLTEVYGDSIMPSSSVSAIRRNVS
jgi:hypothetical protein